jgi:F0F1-type ATP synthase epsilon subunit
MVMEKFLNKENAVIVIAVITIMVQSNYFATKLDVSEVKRDMLQLELAMKKYSDDADKEILSTLEEKLQLISNKIDRIHR